MKLLTKEIIKKLRKYPLGSQEGLGLNAKVLVKFFNPVGRGTWLVTEAEEQPDGDWLFFRYCHIFEEEWGEFLLSDLTSVKLPFGMGIERDIYAAEGKKVADYLPLH